MKKSLWIVLSLLLVCVTALSLLPAYAAEPVKVPATTSDEITYVGNWSTVGETKRSTAADEYCEYTFTGTGIEIWFGRGPGAGIAEIFIDGKSMGKVDMYKANPATELMYSNMELSDGEHTVKIVNTGEKSGNATNVNLAYFRVYAAEAESDTETVKVTINDSGITYGGNWIVVGETMRSTAAEETCEYTFKGTGIEIWFGRGPGAGVAEIFIDGTSMGKVDMYKADPATELMYSKLDLPYGEHTVKIVNTGEKSGSATNVNLAYMTVHIPKEFKEFDRISSQNDAIVYEGAWTLVGETMRSSVADESCQYTFAGKGIEIYFGMGTGAGISEVFIDGKSMGTVDAYSTTIQTSKLFAVSDLEEGIHTVKVVNTGTKNEASTSTNVNIGYFNVELGDTVYVLNADDGAFSTDGSASLTVLLGGSAATVEAVKIGDQTLEKGTDYTVNGLSVTVQAACLKELEAGNYTLTVTTTEGDVAAALTVTKAAQPDPEPIPTPPATGDAMAAAGVVLLLTAVGIAMVFGKRKEQAGA